jgi:hypothetical protein
VINANIDIANDFQPIGPGTVTVLSATTLGTLGTVQLTGINPGSAAVRDRTLFVLNSGTWGGGNSSLSVVNPLTRTQTARVDGFGNFPGSVTTAIGQGVYVAAYGTGVLVYNPDSQVMVRGVASPIIPSNLLPVSVVRFDGMGLLYSLHPGECLEPGTLVQSSPTGVPLAQISVGVCPFALDFTVLPR